MYNPFVNYPISCDWDCHRARGSAGGIDYAVLVGTPIHAPFNGWTTIRTNSVGGNIVNLRRDDGLQIECMHLSKFVTPSYYHEGDIIGYSGGAKGTWGAGDSTGPHIHVNAIDGGRVTNFLDYLPAPAALDITPIEQETDYEMITFITASTNTPWFAYDGRHKWFVTQELVQLLVDTGHSRAIDAQNVKVIGPIIETIPNLV